MPQSALAESAMNSSLLSMGPTEFRLFRDLIHRHTGIWLRENKQVMLASRLAKRLRERHIANFSDYYTLVESHPEGGQELGELINCVTTNKTSFFRESHHFDFLAGTALDQFLLSPPPDAAPAGGRTFRIWSAACSTGEEPYSIAIALLEKQAARSASSRGWNFQIVASDIDTQVLRTAERGVYPAEALADIPAECRYKYFLRGKDDMEGFVRVKKQVAQTIEFLRINLNDQSWALNGTFDAVFFRNALIYFRQETQDLFLRRIIRHMRPQGYLFLGHSEHIPWLHDILEPQKNTVYRRKGGTR